MAIRVGLETSATSFNNAGTVRYITQLLSALEDLNPDDIEFVEINVSQNLRMRQPGILRKVLVMYWESIYCNVVLPSLVKHHQIDVLHCTSPMPIRRKLLSPTIRIVTTIFDIIPFSNPEWFSRVMKIRLKRWILQSISVSDHLITISEFTKQELYRRLGVSAKRVTMTYLGSTDFPSVEDVKIEPTILVVGTLEPRKNLATVIEAYSLLKRGFSSPPSLTIVGGKGWGDNPMSELILRYSLENDVHMLGFISDAKLFTLYKHASMFIYPSLQEGFGLPILEAMACGCPVITSNSSSLPEVLGDAGIMVEPKDVRKLAEAMQRVLTDVGLANDMRQKGLQQAARFSWRKCAEQTVDVYRKMLGK